MLGLAVVGTLVLVVGRQRGGDERRRAGDWVGILEIVLGVALLGLAVRQWRGRPKAGETAPLPKWMQSLDRFTPARSLAIGAALAAINPKNLLLTVAAAAAIAQTGARTGRRPPRSRSSS